VPAVHPARHNRELPVRQFIPVGLEQFFLADVGRGRVANKDERVASTAADVPGQPAEAGQGRRNRSTS